MQDLKPIHEDDRRVANIANAEFTPFFSNGMPDGSVLQLNESKPLSLAAAWLVMASLTVSLLVRRR